MNGKQLKNSILQWAIQGKLVPQDPNDEPASVLLEKIRAEKARLVKEGKIKKEKKESIIYRGEDNSYYEKFADGKVVCIDDEIPFEIPRGWEWCRLGNLVDFSKNKSVKACNIVPNSWLLDLEDIEKDSGKLLQKKRMVTITSISDKHKFEKGNVLYSKLRPYLNKVIIADEEGYCTSEIVCFDFGMIYSKYAQLFLMSPFFVEYAMSDAYGVKMPRLGSKQGNNGLIPIPPIEEQRRIVNFISSLDPFIEKFSKAHASLDKINKKLKETLRKSTLQEAIRGNLVSQNYENEPASVLLQRIKEEKQRLVKEGKLKKKDVVDSVIFKGDDNKYYEQVGKNLIDITDEIPFEIPNNWIWTRIGYLFAHNNGKQLNKSNSVGTLMEYITTSNLYWDGFRLENLKRMPFEENEIERCQAIKGDLLVCEGGDVGRSCIWTNNSSIMLQNHIHKLRAYLPLCTKYFFYIFYMYNLFGLIGGKGIGIQGFSSKALHNTIVPLPPLKEQERIVKKIEAVFNKIKGD